MQCPCFVGGFNKERDVVVAASVRDHSYRDVLHRLDNPGFETNIIPFQVTYHTNDNHIFVYRDRSILFQVVHDLFQMLAVVDRNGNTYFGSRYHVDRSLVVFEYFEHLTQDSGSQQHTAALDPKTAAKVLALSDKIISENNLTAMMVTHNMKDAIAHGNRLIMMHEGRVIYDISGEEKKNLKVSDLLAKFEEVSGGEFANDRMMLS